MRGTFPWSCPARLAGVVGQAAVPELLGNPRLYSIWNVGARLVCGSCAGFLASSGDGGPGARPPWARQRRR